MGSKNGEGENINPQVDPVLEGDTEAAVKFLRLWAPKGPWALVAIRPDKKLIEGDYCTTLEAATKFIVARNGTMNLYFHVNPTTKRINPETKKLIPRADREAVVELAWLHVDIDPREGENLGDEQARALRLLTERLPADVPPPTAIVFSGGGYQGYWRLKVPVPIKGNLDAAEDAKRYNQFIEVAFGADHCHSIEHIMRIPGTLNIPDKKKLAKGRSLALARLVEWHEDRVYPVETFKKTAAEPTAAQGSIAKGPAPAAKLGSVDDLDEYGVPEVVKLAIVQGRAPGENVGDNSRSSWLFYVVCMLIRRRVPEPTILAVITDPSFGISESVLEKGTGAARYANRQLDRAKEEVIEPGLRRLNDKFAVIGNWGGKCRVMEEVYEPLIDRSVLVGSSFNDFRNRHMNELVKVGEKKGAPVFHTLGQWWLAHPLRRYYDRIVFSPGRDIENTYNLWQGFAVEPKPGDCRKYLAHLRNNICRGEAHLYDYLLDWMARAVQLPGQPGEVALVLKGGMGVGKGVAVRYFGGLFGRHFLHVSQPEHLVGNFNAHLADAVIVFADEAYVPSDKRHVSVIKTLITERLMEVERKGVDVGTGANCTHLILASNSAHIIPAGPDERRFAVLQVGDAHKQESSYFEAIRREMEQDGGREALLYMLMHRDISNFNVRAIPMTEALQEQKGYSMGPEEEWWYTKLSEGRLLRSDKQWQTIIPKDDLLDDYITHSERWRLSRRGNATSMGRFMTSILPRLREYRANDGTDWAGEEQANGTVSMWEIGTLEDARKDWEKRFGPWNWEPKNGRELSNGNGKHP